MRVLQHRMDEGTRKLEDAYAAQKAAENAVVARSKDISQFLPIAFRLSRFPAETLLAAPGPPEGAVEGLLAMRAVAAELGRQAAALKAEQQRVRALTDCVDRQRAALGVESAHEEEGAALLEEQIRQADEERTKALGAAAAAARAEAALAAQAEDLRNAILVMDKAERRAAENATQARAPQRHRGQIHLDTGLASPGAASQPAWGPSFGPAAPRIRVVEGRVTRKWREIAEGGPATGVTYGTAPGGFVVSPCAGRVAFAAPFRSYGRLMIIECGQGYDFVLAGMDRVDAKLGLSVQRGDPVGRMRRPSPGSADTPLLYVELRKNGEPIDPSPYLDGKP
jgi:septal ring factor EnvC (AmiA/AmiB activator)